ncbi:MAG: ATP-dependent Clp protease adapter ClpS [Cyanophyceae cyanobacterium]
MLIPSFAAIATPTAAPTAIFAPTKTPIKAPPPAEAPTEDPDRARQTVRKTYPNYKIIVLNDDFNTFQHVSQCLVKYIPHMSADKAWDLTLEIHHDGQAIVWVGPQEQAELYHQQLRREGLTMAPLEKA